MFWKWQFQKAFVLNNFVLTNTLKQYWVYTDVKGLVINKVKSTQWFCILVLYVFVNIPSYSVPPKLKQNFKNLLQNCSFLQKKKTNSAHYFLQLYHIFFVVIKFPFNRHVSYINKEVLQKLCVREIGTLLQSKNLSK